MTFVQETNPVTPITACRVKQTGGHQDNERADDEDDSTDCGACRPVTGKEQIGVKASKRNITSEATAICHHRL